MQKKDYEEDDRRLMESWLYSMGTALALLVLIGVMCLFCGCNTTKYVPAERVVIRSDTVTRYIHQRDSVKVFERIYESDSRYDSIAPILDSLNRVIGWDRYHFHETTKKDESEILRLQSVIDSLMAVKTDSVDRLVPYPVERELTSWEKMKMDFGGMAIGGLGACVIGGLAALTAWMVKRKRRK